MRSRRPTSPYAPDTRGRGCYPAPPVTLPDIGPCDESDESDRVSCCANASTSSRGTVSILSVASRSCPFSTKRWRENKLLIQSSRGTQNKERCYPRVLNVLRSTRKGFRTSLSIGAAAAWQWDASRILDSKRTPGGSWGTPTPPRSSTAN